MISMWCGKEMLVANLAPKYTRCIRNGRFPPLLRQARIGHFDGRTGGANFLSRGVLMAGKSWWQRGFPGKMSSLLRHCQPWPVISTFIRK